MNQLRFVLVGIVWTAFISAGAQSLGDVARQQQQKKAGHSPALSDRVLTNDDLHSGASAEPEQTPPSNPKKIATAKAANAADSKDSAAKVSAEEFKLKIQKQKNEISTIQERINDLQSTINYVQNNRNIYTNAPEYNEVQKRRQQQADQLKSILQERQDELKQLQEQARQAGYGSAVYN